VPGALSRTIRVFIIDDHRMFTQAVAAALTEEPDMEVVGTVDNLADARRDLAQVEADVILLDQRLPDGQGTHAAAELRALRPGAKVILVTAAMDPSVLNEALAAGCAGFVTKGDSIDALSAAVRAAAEGATPVSPAMLNRLTRGNPNGANLTDPLTPRETSVLLFLADGMSNEEISKRLFISIHTLRNHIQSIISKLGAHSKLEAVSIAIREGLITAPGNDY
jgi:DNA-binding NarL/FixJ family response regulator